MNDTSTVDGSSTYQGQLATSGSNGTETFSATSGDTTDLQVSASGAVTATGYLAVGSYTFSGAVTDTFGDTGTWTFTLVVTASTIDQGIPTGDVVTVDGSTSFADQLAPATHDASPVTFVTVTSNPNLAVFEYRSGHGQWRATRHRQLHRLGHRRGHAGRHGHLELTRSR